jgi:hypothetical protein
MILKRGVNLKKNILKVVLVSLSLILIFMLAGCAATTPKAPTPVVASIGDRITALETQHANTDSNAAKLDNRVSAVETDLKKIPDVSDIKEAVTKANAADVKAADAQSKLTDTLSKATDAQTKASDAQSKATDAQSKSADAQAKIVALQKEIEALKSTDGSSTWSQTSKDVEALKTQLTTLQGKVDTLTKTTDGTTDSTDLIDNGELSIKVSSGKYLYINDIGGQALYKPQVAGSGAAYPYLKFKISNESQSDVSVYEIKLTLTREDYYGGDSNLVDYEFEVSTSSSFGTDAFVIDSASAKKVTFYSVVTYDVDADDYDEIPIWIRVKFTQDNELYNQSITDNTYPGRLKLTSSISITDYEELE